MFVLYCINERIGGGGGGGGGIGVGRSEGACETFELSIGG